MSTTGDIDFNEITREARRFIPDPEQSDVAVAAPGAGFGYWNGASSAVEHEGVIYLAYRNRVPIELGRGQGVVVARSNDGIHFETIQTIDKSGMDAESLERPALVRTQDGRWRLYLSCATTGTKHWRVELLEADTPDGFDVATRRTVMPGDDQWAVKDPVIQFHDRLWHCWATFHPLDVKDAEDRMVSRYAVSRDGINWIWSVGNCLEPRDGMWDSRGARITAVRFLSNCILAYYDGRASAAENYEERTGIAVGALPDSFSSISEEPLGQSPQGNGLRYLDIVPFADGSHRSYYEVARDDGSHELRTTLIT